MKQWTPEAEQRLEDYLEEVAEVAREKGDAPEELVEDLRAHARIAMEGIKESVVTDAQVERILAEMGTPDVIVWGDNVDTETLYRRYEKAVGAKVGRKTSNGVMHQGEEGRGWLTFLGVVLPAIAIVLELVMGPLASFYMSPMPTIGHVLLLAGVPLIYLFLLWKLPTMSGEPHPAFPRGISACLGYLLAVTTAYSVALAGSALLCLFGIMLAGAGLIGFAPYGAFVATLVLVCRFSHAGMRLMGRDLCWVAVGAAPVIAFLGWMHFPDILVERHVERSMRGEEAQRNAALSQLRAMNSAPYLQRRYLSMMGAIERQGGVLLPHYLLASYEAQPYREAYFRVTGRNVEDAPFHASLWRMDGKAGHNFALSGARRSPLNNGRDPSLHLAGSTLDVNIDDFAHGGIAYSELVLEFQNHARWELEAQCLIELPPGGVASRLTLWINGEPHEAAFGGKSQVQQAYEEVAVVQRRDPALLVSAGKDRTFLRCFPVPSAGTMKVRVGITSPLVVRGGKAYYLFPRISGENFNIGNSAKHGIWIESQAPISLVSDNLDASGFQGGARTLRASTGGSLVSEGGYVVIPGEEVVGSAVDVLGEHATVQRIEAPDESALNRPLWILIDGSASVGDAGVDWKAFIEAFPATRPIHVRISGVPGLSLDGAGDRAMIVESLASYQFSGGYELYADLAAIYLDALNGGGDVLLIHGVQPLFSSEDTRLEQILARTSADLLREGSRLYTLSLADGRQGAMAELEERVRVSRVPIIDSIQESLNNFALRGAPEDIVRSYRLESRTEGAQEGSGHLVRMAMAEHVAILLADARPEAVNEARKLATRYRVVTPVSGAVVLERKEQYDRHDLNPDVNLDAVPAIPEPETWALLVVGAIAVLIGWARWRRKVAGLSEKRYLANL